MLEIETDTTTIIPYLDKQIAPYLEETKKRVFDVLEQNDWNEMITAEHSNHPLLKPEEERELLEIAIAGRDDAGNFVTPEAAKARDLLIAYNTRLILSIVLSISNTKGVPLRDLFQEGAIGLMRALSKFEFNSDGSVNRLSTYATWWIKQKISIAINTQGDIAGVPRHLAQKIPVVYRAKESLVEKLGRTPTFEDIAIETGIPLCTVVTVMEINEVAYSLPLDTLYFLGYRDEYFDGALPEIVDEILAMKDSDDKPIFSERERDIIISRFGLNNKIPETLKSIGKHHGVSDERIRQIQKGAMRKFQKYEDLLIDFYE